MFLITPSVKELRGRFKTHLSLVYEHDEGRRGPHGIPSGQLVSSTYLDIDLHKSDETGLHPPSFLFSNLFESGFDEATRSACGGCEERNNSTVRL